jgi:hypothetical protein
VRVSKILLSLVIVIVAAAAAAASSAFVLPTSAATFQDGPPGLMVSTNGLRFRVRSMSPGSRASQFVTARNTGDGAGDLTFGAAVSGSRLMAESLIITVAIPDGVAYRGRLADLDQVQIVSLRRGEAIRVRLDVELPASAENELQGLASDAAFTWTLTQT